MNDAQALADFLSFNSIALVQAANFYLRLPSMVREAVDCIVEETKGLPVVEVENQELSEVAIVPKPLKIHQASTRTSLRASTLDGVFAAIFSCATTGVLLTNFLLELGATTVEIGFLSSIPMFVNLLQPLGAHLAERTTSRHKYGLWIFGLSRILWLILLVGIVKVGDSQSEHYNMIMWTMVVVFATFVLNALGCASWFSWMAALVPRRLRGRYFGIRNSAANLINLICVPLMGLGVSAWVGGSIQGYGIILFLGVAAGLLSLGFQFFMRDVNPQEQAQRKSSVADDSTQPQPQWYKDGNFLRFLVYFSGWMFAFNLSAPFFNLYMLDNLHLDVSLVTVYTSLTAGANLLMLMAWGKLADRIGNRPILVLVGILVAVTPLLWLGTGTHFIGLWVWLPFIHLLTGGTCAAIDLCNNNIQMSVAPSARAQSTYFAIAAAVAGVTGALGTSVGGFLAQLPSLGGLPGLFALSAVLRLVALLPLIFVQEHRSQSITQLWCEVKLVPSRLRQSFLPAKPQPLPVEAVGLVDRAE